MKGEQKARREAEDALRRVIWELSDVVRAARFVPKRVRRAVEDASFLASAGDTAGIMRRRSERAQILEQRGGKA